METVAWQTDKHICTPVKLTLWVRESCYNTIITASSQTNGR